MRCLRCAGWMSCEAYPGDVAVETPWARDNWRCVHCGELVDAVILTNRERSGTGVGQEGRVAVGSP